MTMPHQLDHHLMTIALGAGALVERPHLFSDMQITLPRVTYEALAEFVRQVTHLVTRPTYQAAVAERQGCPITPMPPGVCLAFDFHVGDQAGDAPKLIEINTNAGGSLLVTLLERAWGHSSGADHAEAALLQMFIDEWHLWNADRPLKTIAIVDETPEQQYLYPEFVRWQKLFEANGLQTLICAPEQLACDDAGRLWLGQEGIDLIYNRLTDFTLKSEPCRAIHRSWRHQLAGEKQGTLISPHPQSHALWADKRNLEWLSDEKTLQRFGLDTAQIEAILPHVPRTVPVLKEAGELFWNTRKQWFFKPQAGFGSRATYRGDKLTKRVFEEILQGGYVAQTFAPPPEITVTDRLNQESMTLKYDLRVYVCAGKILLLAARLYQGQTTNFRTPGGGFAPVLVR